MKVTFIFLLMLSLVSCGKSGNSSESNKGLQDEYFPLGLSNKVIESDGNTHAPMDLISQELTMTFDPEAETAKGKSVIKFKLHDQGHPYFELKATPKNIKLDAASVSITSISDPDGQNQTYLSLEQDLAPGEVHQVEFEYTLPVGRVSYTGGGVRFLTDMTDLNGKFFEYWGPTGFEGDAFAMNLTLKTIHATSSHVLRTNGEITSAATDTWKISFPDYFSKSSFYVHLTNQTTLPSKKFVYQGLEREIPVEVYGVTTSLVNSAGDVLPKLFKELEADYGPYPHAKFLAYMNDRSGGMEYVGATITSVASIDHELLHSWFARSVIPADGRSGWIDEAMASWRDYGYSTAKSTLGRAPTNLAAYSPYRKSTPGNSYVDGRALMAELDLEFSSIGGLKPVMKAFFAKYKNRVVNNEEFWHFLEEYTKVNVDAFNERYAMGETEQVYLKELTVPDSTRSKHPTPLTEAELERLR